MSHGTRSARTLYVKDSDYRAATLEETLAAARRALKQRFRPGCQLTSPELVRDYLRLQFGMLEHEVFALMLLNTQHRLLARVELFRGTIDGAAIYPREVVKEVLKHNAAAVILVHNHPSGQINPSGADELITRRLKEVLALIDVRVIDHMIVSGTGVLSFAESGLL